MRGPSGLLSSVGGLFGGLLRSGDGQAPLEASSGGQGGLMGLLQDSHSRSPNPVLSNSKCNIEYNKPNLKLKLMLVLHLIFV